MPKLSDLVLQAQREADRPFIDECAIAVLPELIRYFAQPDDGGDSLINNGIEMGMGELTTLSYEGESLTHAELIAMHAYSIAMGMANMRARMNS